MKLTDDEVHNINHTLKLSRHLTLEVWAHGVVMYLVDQAALALMDARRREEWVATTEICERMPVWRSSSTLRHTDQILVALKITRPIDRERTRHPRAALEIVRVSRRGEVTTIDHSSSEPVLKRIGGLASWLALALREGGVTALRLIDEDGDAESLAGGV